MRILILYPGLYEERRKLVQPYKWRLLLTGTKIVVADDRLHPEDEKVFADVLQLPPADQAEQAWQVLARYLERNPVDGIIAQSEPALLLGARAARAFGLRGPTVESALASVNKFTSRTKLKTAGIPQPAFALVRDAQGIRGFAKEHGWPVVIKAVASSRQRLVMRVSSEQDLQGALQCMRTGLPLAQDVRRLASFAKLEGLDLGLDPFQEFLVESFQEGLPLECDAMLSGTSPHWFGVCEQVPSRQSGFFIEGYLLPGRLTKSQQRSVQGTAQAAVQALGLSNTGVSVELRWHRDQAHIIEVNGRLPWDDGLQDLIQAATGQVPGSLALKVAMGRPLPQITQRRHAALLYRSSYEEGVLAQTPHPAAWKACTASAHGAWMFAQQGDRLLHGDHPDSRPHLAGVLSTDAKSTQAAMDHAAAAIESLAIEVQPSGQGHLTPQAARDKPSLREHPTEQLAEGRGLSLG